MSFRVFRLFSEKNMAILIVELAEWFENPFALKVCPFLDTRI